MATDIILAELQKISSRLAAIEAKVGGAAPQEEGERSRLAVDFENSIVNVAGKAVVDAAKAIGGAEGEKLVSTACFRTFIAFEPW